MMHKVEDGEQYHFPMDDLLVYLADRGIESETCREHVKAQIIAKRQQVGPDVYQRFQVNLGPELPLFLTCKNDRCKLLLMTQLKGRKCEKAIWGPENVECPGCHCVYEYNQDDLHFGQA
jgi:hypothetical protein